MVSTKDYLGYMLFFFENGKVSKVDMQSYYTKTNRKKLVGAYSDKSPIVQAIYIQEDTEFLLTSSFGRMLILHTGAINAKSTRSNQGVAVMTLKKGHRLISVKKYKEGDIENPNRYRTKNIPAVGAMLSSKRKDKNQLEF